MEESGEEGKKGREGRKGGEELKHWMEYVRKILNTLK